MVIQENVYLYILNKYGPEPQIYVHQVELYTFCDYSDSANEKRIINWPAEGTPGYFELDDNDKEWEAISFGLFTSGRRCIYCRERDDKRAKKIFVDEEKFTADRYECVIKDLEEKMKHQKLVAEAIENTEATRVRSADSESQ